MRPLPALALLFALSPLLEEEPRLVLEAPRVQLLRPDLAAQGYGKRVEVTAKLEGEPGDPKAYYCLDEVWDWDDGTESVYETDCDPYVEGTEIRREFRDSHYYRPGDYEISLRLTRGEKIAVKGFVTVRIH